MRAAASVRFVQNAASVRENAAATNHETCSIGDAQMLLAGSGGSGPENPAKVATIPVESAAMNAKMGLIAGASHGGAVRSGRVRSSGVLILAAPRQAIKRTVHKAANQIVKVMPVSNANCRASRVGDHATDALASTAPVRKRANLVNLLGSSLSGNG